MNTTQVRIKPLKSCEKNSTKYSLDRSLSHDLREYDEEHIDKSKPNIFLEKINKNIIYERLENVKKKYGMVCKNSTIDVANFVFTVNKNFFENNDEKKEFFLLHVNEFLKKECGEDAVLSVIGHDDEDGFHVHAYAVPLHKTLFKNRHKENEKIVINYRGKYSHSQKEIAEFRKNHMADKTKTGELQTRWAQFAKQLFPELERGKKQSEAKHISPKEYRKMIEKTLPELEKKNENLLKNNEKLSEENKKLNNEKNVLLSEIDLYKSEVELGENEKAMRNDLRKISPIEVAKLLGRNSFPSHINVNGKTEKISNSFDYLIHVEGMSFSGATKFLYEHFSANRVEKTVKENVESETPLYNRIKNQLIKKQMQALGNPVVRVTCQKIKDGKKIGVNLTKNNETGEEFFWNTEQIISNLHKLNRYNADGWNIYITPIEYEHGDNFTRKIPMLIDDVKDIEKIRNDIGEPDLIMETSPGNYQVVYCVENDIDYTQSKKKIEEKRGIYNQVFKAINQKYGDEKISGLRHCMRLAGFTNQKPEHEGEFVKLTSATKNPQNNVKTILESAEKYTEEKRKNVEIAPRTQPQKMQEIEPEIQESIEPEYTPFSPR